MQRAARFDGLLPNVMGENGQVRMSPATPNELRQMHAWVEAHRVETTPFDIIIEGATPGDDPQIAAATVRPYAEAGATWWIEALWTADDLDQALQRVQQGPPKGND